MTVKVVTIKVHRDTAANWASVNPIPKIGEPCFETDTQKLKIGDGSSNYNDLSYIIGSSAFTDFTLTADSGTNQTIADGNTLDIEGGTGISTVVGATDKVTVSIDSSVVTKNDQQTLTNKTLLTPTILLYNENSPTPTTEGRIEWDTDGNFICVGDGAGTQTFANDTTNASTYAPIGHVTDTANPHSVDIDDVTPTTTKGDILVENGSNVIRLPVGTDDHVLTADSSEASGVKWAPQSAGVGAGITNLDGGTPSSVYDSIDASPLDGGTP